MNVRLVRNLTVLIAVAASALSAAALSDPLQEGEAYYFSGDFKKAKSQFELKMKASPNEPEPYLWLGRSYAVMADLKAPVLSTRTRLKARMYLAKAVELSPRCADCRHELLALLLESDDSISGLPETKILLANTPESDPDYASLQALLAQRRHESLSPEHVMTALVGAPSQTLAGLGVHPAHSVRDHHVSLREQVDSPVTRKQALLSPRAE
jgi:tetratricopeptide (TPR) repeat protein